MQDLPCNLVIAAAALVALARPGGIVSAQVVPGRDDSPRVAPLAAQYRAYVHEGVRSALTDWTAAWTERDPKALARVYSEDAVLISNDGAAHLGRQAIREYAERVLPYTGRATVSLLDSDYGDYRGDVFQLGEYRIPVSQDGTTWIDQTGWQLSLITPAGRNWRVRAQLLLPIEAPSFVLEWSEGSSPFEPLTLQRVLGDEMRCLEGGLTVEALLEAGPRRRAREARACGRAWRFARSYRLATDKMISWSAAWRHDDLDEAVAAFSEDGILILPGEEPLFGRSAIRARLEEILPTAGDLSSIVDYADGSGMKFVYGPYHCRCGSGKRLDGLGRFVSVLKFDDRGWRMRALVMWADGGGPGDH